MLATQIVIKRRILADLPDPYALISVVKVVIVEGGWDKEETKRAEH